MVVQIQVRRDTAANWTSEDPTLAEGEMGLETDTTFFKFGDGSTAWTSLPYVQDGLGVPAGGTTGQRLAKASNADYDTEWVTAAAAAIDLTGDTGSASSIGDVTFAGTGGIAVDVNDDGGGAATVTIDGSGVSGGGGGTSQAPALKKAYIQSATNGTSHAITITAASSGDRIVVVVSSRGRDVNTPTCTNVTFTEVLAANFGTSVYLSAYVGVVAGGSSGTTITVTATGSNWIITDTYVVGDALTPTAGTAVTVTNTAADAIAGTNIGPISCSLGDFFIFAVTDDDGSASFSQLMCSSHVFRGAVASSGVALMSGIGRAGATSVSGYFNGGTTNSDFAGGIVAVT